MADAPDRTFFFIHVMKTGGTTFVQHLPKNFAAEALYPGDVRGDDRLRAYYLIDELRALSPERRARIRAYAGHFPYAASALVGADVTMTILREPVERVVSYLRHRKRHHDDQRDLSLEEIYADTWVFRCYVHNYQVKLFAMTADDKLESHLDSVEMDDERLAIACATLERVDVVGLNDHYDAFVSEVHDQFGWRFGRAPNLRVSTEDWDVSAEFRERIAADNAADVAFYEFARGLHARRREQGPAGSGPASSARP